MKLKNILLCSIAVSACVLAVSSCEDYPDAFTPTGGLPTVHYIRYAENDNVIEQAFMQETICIVGDNLKSIHEIWFNDRPAVLNTSLMTDHTLLVQVPKGLPEVQTDRIYLITRDKETVECAFKVLAPKAIIKAMSFEYAEPGSEAFITGEYLIEPEIEFPNAKVTNIISNDGNKIVFTVPEGALPGKVKITTPSGVSASPFMYMDNRGLLFDFDGTNGLYTINKGWHATPIVDGGVSGQCLCMDGSAETISADGGDWHDGAFHFEYWAGNWQDPETYGDWDGRRLNDIIDFSDFAKMCLKFEVCIDADKAWTGCPMQIIFSDVTLVSNGNAGVTDKYGNTLAGCNNTYMNDSGISLPRYLWRPWKESGSFHTNGQWQTVTIPIAEFTSFWDGTVANGSLTKESFANLEFFFAGGSKSEGSAGPAPTLKIDNIRAVPVR